MPLQPDRRDFLKKGLAATATVLTVGPGAFFDTPEAHAQSFPDVVVVQGSDPALMTRSAVDALGGMQKFVKPGNKVVIKPI